MKLCEVYSVQTGSWTKWVVVSENGKGNPAVVVVNNKSAVQIACRMLGCDNTVNVGVFSLVGFLEVAASHEILSKIRSWEPFGF